MDDVKPVYPPFNFVESRGIIMVQIPSMHIEISLGWVCLHHAQHYLKYFISDFTNYRNVLILTIDLRLHATQSWYYGLDRDRGRQRDRQTGRATDRQANKLTDWLTGRETETDGWTERQAHYKHTHTHTQSHTRTDIYLFTHWYVSIYR